MVLTNDANGRVVADANRLQRIGDTRRVVADAIRIVPNTAEDALYVHTDHLGSPQKMTDETAAVVWHATFEPYGREVSITGTETNNQRFPGQYYDAETGLSYNWHRYYDPSIGRYITADPIGLNGGMNLYAYANANPVNFVDPEGLQVALPMPGPIPLPIPPVMVPGTPENKKMSRDTERFLNNLLGGIFKGGQQSRPVPNNDNNPEGTCPLERELPENQCTLGNRSCVYLCPHGQRRIKEFSRTFQCEPWIFPHDGRPFAPTGVR